jgi:hypothetical protein
VLVVAQSGPDDKTQAVVIGTRSPSSRSDFAKIAAALSGDENVMASYRSGDSYLDFAKKAGALPPEATKNSHPAIRNKYKECCLGVQYGMEAPSLALRINRPEIEARSLLLTHRNLYRQSWAWVENYVMQGSLANYQTAGFGWTYHILAGYHPYVHGERRAGFNPRMLQKFQCRRPALKYCGWRVVWRPRTEFAVARLFTTPC